MELELLPEPMDGYQATWQVTVSKAGPVETDELVKPLVADPEGAARWGSLWHLAVMGCCGAGVEDAVEVLVSMPEIDGARSGKKKTTLFADKELDKLAAQAQLSEQPADVLMRAVQFHHVCSTWEDAEGLQRVEQFWGTNVGDKGHFELGAPSQHAARFISHVWVQPDNWHEVMGQRCSYAEMKGTELYLTALDIAEGEDCEPEDVTFWIDKCCIPQRHTLMPVCISLIEDFLDRCEGMVVLFTWHYFERLWCVYEWAAFLVRHPPENINICLDVFMRPASRELYINSIRNLTVDGCRCTDDGDRLILKEKVSQYYVSEAAFEELARCSAIAMIARTLCSKGASRGKAAWQGEYLPWIAVAKELGLNGLAGVLESAEAWLWRTEAIQCAGLDGHGLVTDERGWQAVFLEKVDEWFSDEVVPVLNAVKASAVLPQFQSLSSMKSRLVDRRGTVLLQKRNSSMCSIKNDYCVSE